MTQDVPDYVQLAFIKIYPVEISQNSATKTAGVRKLSDIFTYGFLVSKEEDVCYNTVYLLF